MHVHAVSLLTWQVIADLNTPVSRSTTSQALPAGLLHSMRRHSAGPVACTLKAGSPRAATPRAARPAPPSDRGSRGMTCHCICQVLL